MEYGGFVGAGHEFSNHIRQWIISVHDMIRLGIKRENPEMPYKIEGVLKEAGIVPKDAYLIGFWHPYNINGYIVRFVHRSFPAVQPGHMVADEFVDLSKIL